jgi:1-aminocyclopropane-1-carboxylate deaminase/D-cysteine desulfhydrase-like pyridoxal-dependent ACC family enzyme
MLQRGDFKADDDVVFLHTGGAASLFAYPELVATDAEDR